MAEYQPMPLSHMPQREAMGYDFSEPLKMIQQSRRDEEAKRQANAAIALRDREQGFRESQGEQTLAMQGREADRGEAHSRRRYALYGAEEARRSNQVTFDRKRLEHEDIEKWAHLMAYGSTPQEREYAASMLQGMHGKTVEHIYPDEPMGPAASGGPGPYDPTLGGTLQADDALPMGKAPPMKPAGAPMGKADAGLSSELDNIDKTYSKGLGVAPGAGMPYKAALAAANLTGALGVKQVGPDQWVPIPKAESDQANADNAGPAAPKYLPGRNPVGARSEALLSEGDPYNKL